MCDSGNHQTTRAIRPMAFSFDEETDDDEEDPKYLKRMFDYSETIDKANRKRESMKIPKDTDYAGHLFGRRYSARMQSTTTTTTTQAKSSSPRYGAELGLRVLKPSPRAGSANKGSPRHLSPIPKV